MDLLKNSDITHLGEEKKSEEQLNTSASEEKVSLLEPDISNKSEEQKEQNPLIDRSSEEFADLELEEPFDERRIIATEEEDALVQEPLSLDSEEEACVCEECEQAVKNKKEKAGWISTAILALVCIFVAFVNFAWLYCVRVEGDSMNNTLETGDYLVVDKLAKIERGNVIVFTGSFAGSVEKSYIKRVVGVAGDTVRISNGKLLLQKEGESGFRQLDYPGVIGETLFPGIMGDVYQKIVPEGHVFVLGDNRENSKDSRLFGFIPLDCVDGVVHDYVIERKDGFLGKICEGVFKTREFVYIKILKRAYASL